MGKEFDFKSQICTDRFQSERLLALGLKKETADCIHFHTKEKGWEILVLEEGDTAKYVEGFEIPAWSLGRLIEIVCNGQNLKGDICSDIIFDEVIDCIEHEIKEGYFPKEYLNGTAED